MGWHVDEFIERLRKRKIVQWALAYVAASFALIQVLDIIAQRFGWPEHTVRFIIITFAIGFFVVLVLAWYHGERGAQRVTGTELLILTLLLSIGGAVVWRLAPLASEQLATASKAAAMKSTSSGEAPVSEKSIAVLPFVNMSGDAQNEYFSDGISEELLNVLARTPDLQVAARTSSFSFKGGKLEVPEIARELKVRMVVEGSVRKQGERVRITAQLIDASDGFHLWSQAYDRDLNDIFAIQDEIANAIAGELKVKLGTPVAVGTTSTGTRNLEAYDLYLRGLALWQLRREDTLWQAIELFERAAKADPGYAQAYAGQSLVFAVLGDYSTRISYADAYRKARNFAERALALDPTLPEPYAALGAVARDEMRRDDADALLRRAIVIRPSFATAHQFLGTNQLRAGHLNPALAALERASTLDPRSLVVAENHSWVLLTLGRPADAKAVCARVLAFAPDYAGCIDNVAFLALLEGDPQEARPLLDRVVAATNPGAAVQVQELIDALQGRGDRHAFSKRLAASPHRSNLDPASKNLFNDYEIPPLLVVLGENELALTYLEDAVRSDDSNNMEWAIMLPTLDPIRCDPHFVALVKKLATSDPYFDKTCKGRP